MHKHIHFWTLMAALMLPSTWLAAAASSTDEITVAPAEADTTTESALEQKFGLRRERYLQVITQCQRIYTEVKGDTTAEQNTGPQAPESLEMLAESCPADKAKANNCSHRLGHLDRLLQDLERIQAGGSLSTDKGYVKDSMTPLSAFLGTSMMLTAALAAGCLVVAPMWLGFHSRSLGEGCGIIQCPEDTLDLGCTRTFQCIQGSNGNRRCGGSKVQGCLNFAHDSANLQPYDIDKDGFCVFPSLPATIQDPNEVEQCTEIFQLTANNKVTGACPQGCLIPDNICWDKNSQQLVPAIRTEEDNCRAKVKRFVTAAWATPVAFIGFCITGISVGVAANKLKPQPDPDQPPRKLSRSQEKRVIREIKERIASNLEGLCKILDSQD